MTRRGMNVDISEWKENAAHDGGVRIDSSLFAYIAMTTGIKSLSNWFGGG